MGNRTWDSWQRGQWEAVNQSSWDRFACSPESPGNSLGYISKHLIFGLVIIIFVELYNHSYYQTCVQVSETEWKKMFQLLNALYDMFSSEETLFQVLDLKGGGDGGQCSGTVFSCFLHSVICFPTILFSIRTILFFLYYKK